ncbi:ABC transporter substrate-binding protein [Dethiothermospora halolimnae]|uniref:ABC transporter substrate-binding protein n=1 Tax=Dethiothermospora halolimnae TaxID=3114390 RepID=UPI003CCBF95B
MVGKRFISIGLIVLIFMSILGGCEKSPSSETASQKELFKIGITQLIEHPALDSSRKGFIDALKSKGFKDGKNIDIDFQNAQGDIPTAEIIGKNFVSQNKDLILAIATPSAQSAYNATKDIPILITAVTDPVKSGLVKAMDKSDTNVTGTSDAMPIDKQFHMIKKLIPKAKKVGILYNTSEINSEIQVNRAKKTANDLDLEIITTGVTNINEVSQSLDALLNKVDVLYTPTDNLVASAMPLIFSKSIKKNIPIIGAEKAHVEGGALSTEGIDYYKLGHKTGLMAVEIIEGKNPKDMPIATLDDTQSIINLKVAKKLNIEIPKDILDSSIIIEGGK